MTKVEEQLKDVPEILNLKEAADLLRISKYSMPRLMKNGLRSYREGGVGQRKFLKIDIIDYIEKSMAEE